MLIPQRYEFSSKSQPTLSVLTTLLCCCWYHKGTNFQANHNRSWLFPWCRKVVADTTKVRIFKQITTILCFTWISIGLLLIPQRYEFSSKSQHKEQKDILYCVVADTTKVRIFKQITTKTINSRQVIKLLLIPQRYEFSSKSQPLRLCIVTLHCCCWYHKGTNFQANHNEYLKVHFGQDVVADTTKVRIFKQITTQILLIAKVTTLLLIPQRYEFSSKSQRVLKGTLWTRCCCWYHKGTNFQANHNTNVHKHGRVFVVADTTKVRIFKQITTNLNPLVMTCVLLLIPQRYEFSSKSQQRSWLLPWCRCCCWYHKGTNFQANHNSKNSCKSQRSVVADTTKVRIFKQITTHWLKIIATTELLLIPQRYEFSSKSQQKIAAVFVKHVVADTTKVRIFKQITTQMRYRPYPKELLLIPQRYEFSSKSQLSKMRRHPLASCCWYHKGTNFQANHNTHVSYIYYNRVVADTTKVRIFKQITTDFETIGNLK